MSNAPVFGFPTTIVSSATPQKGHNNKSSGDFQFNAIPPTGVQLIMPDGVHCILMQDQSIGADPIVHILYKGVIIPASKLKSETPYYIGAPQGASEAFNITFTAYSNL